MAQDAPGDLAADARAMQIGHSLVMVAELPTHAFDDSLAPAVHIAIIDSFFSHARALMEFLVMPPKADRLHRSDYLAGWDSLHASEQVLRTQRYSWVSTHGTHFGRERVTTPGTGVERVTAAELNGIAAELLDVAGEFAEALDAAGSPWGPVVAGYIDEARRHRV